MTPPTNIPTPRTDAATFVANDEYGQPFDCVYPENMAELEHENVMLRQLLQRLVSNYGPDDIAYLKAEKGRGQTAGEITVGEILDILEALTPPTTI